MNNYSLALILKPDLSEEKIKAFLAELEEVIKKEKGEWGEVEEWGKRSLAYPIAGKQEGFYFFLNFKLKADSIKVLQDKLKLKEEILRLMFERL